MLMEQKTQKDSRRRFFAILAAPSLALHHTHTTPMLELAYLRRIGLSKTEADDFLALMCERGCMDEGARALLETGGEAPAQRARQMLAGHAKQREDIQEDKP